MWVKLALVFCANTTIVQKARKPSIFATTMTVACAFHSEVNVGNAVHIWTETADALFRKYFVVVKIAHFDNSFVFLRLSTPDW